MYDVSLICEEDLLTTIFCACDVEHTGLPVAFRCPILFPSQQIFKVEIMLRFLRLIASFRIHDMLRLTSSLSWVALCVADAE